MNNSDKLRNRCIFGLVREGMMYKRKFTNVMI